jgi:lipoate-protein ligase A
MSGWPVETERGTATSLLGRQALGHGERTTAVDRSATVLEVTAPALVLGSTQRDEVVDRGAAERLGIDVVRRRTGGGAVLLMPDAHVWVDVVVPADDPLWSDDVAEAFAWLGEAWVVALTTLGIEGTVANETAVCHSILGRLICFAGLGYGEVSGPGGKIVGLAQRRSRAGSWFQCAVLRRWDPAAYGALLAPGLGHITDAPGREVADVHVQPVPVEPSVLVEAFIAALPPR